MTPQIIHTADADGAPVVKVELGNRPGRFATLDLADYRAWVAGGRTTRWFINDNGNGREYVKFARPDVTGRLHGVARMIVSPGKGRVVSYRNGDPTDLRRDNLRVSSGKAPGPTITQPEFFAEISEAA